jgi:hypothetical protein
MLRSALNSILVRRWASRGGNGSAANSIATMLRRIKHIRTRSKSFPGHACGGICPSGPRGGPFAPACTSVSSIASSTGTASNPPLWPYARWSGSIPGDALVWGLHPSFRGRWSQAQRFRNFSGRPPLTSACLEWYDVMVHWPVLPTSREDGLGHVLSAADRPGIRHAKGARAALRGCCVPLRVKQDGWQQRRHARALIARRGCR